MRPYREKRTKAESKSGPTPILDQSWRTEESQQMLRMYTEAIAETISNAITYCREHSVRRQDQMEPVSERSSKHCRKGQTLWVHLAFSISNPSRLMVLEGQLQWIEFCAGWFYIDLTQAKVI